MERSCTESIRRRFRKVHLLVTLNSASLAHTIVFFCPAVIVVVLLLLGRCCNYRAGVDSRFSFFTGYRCTRSDNGSIRPTTVVVAFEEKIGSRKEEQHQAASWSIVVRTFQFRLNLHRSLCRRRRRDFPSLDPLTTKLHLGAVD